MKNETAVCKNSLYRRWVMSYLVISILTTIILCAVWYKNTSKWLYDQNSSYNLQQLEALYKEFYKQNLSLKQTEYRIYTYPLEEDVSLYNFVENYLSAVQDYDLSDLASYQQQRSALNSYITLIERPRDNGMTLFMLTGKNYSSQDIYLSYTDGRVLASDYAQLVNSHVREISADPSRRYTYIVPTFTMEGYEGSMQAYVIYDILRDIENPSDQIGYVINAYSPDTLSAVLDSFFDPLIGRAYVIDYSGHILYDSQNGDLGGLYQDFDIINEKKNKDIVQGKTHTTVLYNNSFSFYVVGVLEESSIFALGTGLYIQIAFVALLTCILALLLSSLLVRSHVKPLSTLLGSLYRARTNIKERAPLSGNQDELDLISSGVNEMLDRIEDYIDEAYAQEIERQSVLLQQREAELRALEYQVNPHFLYNSLETIRMKALSNKDDDIAMMIMSLASLFKARIKGSSVITLQQEINFCNQLLKIYNVRYNCTVDIDEDIDSELFSYAVLRDMLTCIFENIMVHAVGKDMDPEDLSISIQGYREADDFILCVSDNGVGFTAQRLFEINERIKQPVSPNSGYVGLANINSRIRMVYGEKYGLKIYSAPGKGTIVVIRLRVFSFEELNERVTKHLHK